ELLGVLRTQELLAARNLDGGEQFFSRANDFGYSKHPDETLKIWNKEQVLADVVQVIRTFRPDIIVNRFDHRSPGTTHGHHTTSAMLGVEAFDLAGDTNAFPEQLEHNSVWQPRRLFFNTSWWFYGSRENFEKADKSRLLSVDIGAYYPLSGLSNNEIAARSRSQHRSQGFGTLSTRGSQEDYLELIQGDLPQDKTNLFDGIDTRWTRLQGGKAIGDILYGIEANFNFKNPSVHIGELMNAYERIHNLEDRYWREIKSKQIKELIAGICGLYLEASADQAFGNPGQAVPVSLEAINRSHVGITLKSVILGNATLEDQNLELTENKRVQLKRNLDIPKDAQYSSPYWLKDKGSLGMYTVAEVDRIGLPETPRAFHATFTLEIAGKTINYTKAVVHRYSKPDKGELYAPFEIVPKATVRLSDNVFIFSNSDPKEIEITVKAHADNVQGSVELPAPKGWVLKGQPKEFHILKKGDEQTFSFLLTPPSYQDETFIAPVVKINGRTLSQELVQIAYDHIPTQSILLPAESKIVRLDIQKIGEHIGYVQGAGDKIPESLEQIGYTVHTIQPDDITLEELQKYDAVVMGIRAYNVVPELKFKQRYLLDYVKKGGNLIVQYNTAGRWNSQFEGIAPYPITLSRDRVTDENSEVKILAKSHPLVQFPNSIEPEDFDGWVQERGLYFPKKWSPEFTAILSMGDQGETSKEGSLIVAPYGDGNYIYTGLSFFRELPAGVPGAFKLFSNMLSLGKEKIKTQTPIKG
ncbi:MAG: LmbE family protein, partial [Bacteroidota bacterium]